MHDIFVYILFYLVFLMSVGLRQLGCYALAYRLTKATNQTAFGYCDPFYLVRKDRVGMVFFPLLSFWAWGLPLGYSPIPVSSSYHQKKPFRTAGVALAGIASHFLIVLGCLGLVKVGMYYDVLKVSADFDTYKWVYGSTGQVSECLALVLSTILWVNLGLAAFLMLPVPPLNGYVVLSFLLGRQSRLKSLRDVLWHPIGSMVLLSLSLQIVPQWVVSILSYLKVYFLM